MPHKPAMTFAIFTVLPCAGTTSTRTATLITCASTRSTTPCYPAIVECGLRVARLGNSSVRYELGLFTQGESAIAASGYFIDVFVDKTEKPCTIPAPLRAHLQSLLVPARDSSVAT